MIVDVSEGVLEWRLLGEKKPGLLGGDENAEKLGTVGVVDWYVVEPSGRISKELSRLSTMESLVACL